MINPNPNTRRTELQDLQPKNSLGLTYPLSAALEIPVVDAGPGFDVLDLEARLGPERFKQLMGSVKQVFCANHRKYPDGHELAGSEVHCLYLSDVEAFLAQEVN